MCTREFPVQRPRPAFGAERHRRRHVQQVLRVVDVGEQRQRRRVAVVVDVRQDDGPQLPAAGRRRHPEAPVGRVRAQPAGRRGHDAAEPQRDARAAARHRPVPASARARHQQQPADARTRVRGPAAAQHAGGQEQSDQRRRVPARVRQGRPSQGAQHQRQPAVALPQTADVRHHPRVPVHGQQQPGGNTQGHQPAGQVRPRWGAVV